MDVSNLDIILVKEKNMIFLWLLLTTLEVSNIFLRHRDHKIKKNLSESMINTPSRVGS